MKALAEFAKLALKKIPIAMIGSRTAEANRENRLKKKAVSAKLQLSL
jgi:xanthine/CO dehydrogenase XdhC/CoxF family maturation factor